MQVTVLHNATTVVFNCSSNCNDFQTNKGTLFIKTGYERYSVESLDFTGVTFLFSISRMHTPMSTQLNKSTETMYVKNICARIQIILKITCTFNQAQMKLSQNRMQMDILICVDPHLPLIVISLMA